MRVARLSAFAAIALFLAPSGFAQPCAVSSLDDTVRVGLAPIPFRSGPPTALLAGDLDRDGAADLLRFDATARRLWIHRGRRDRDLRMPARKDMPAVAELETVLDFQGFGKTDLFVLTDSGPALLLGDGTGTFRTVPVTGVATSAPPARWLWADLDGDGAVDITTVTSGPATSSMETFLGDGRGAFRHAGSAPLGSASAASVATWIEDVDGDGKRDALVSPYTGAEDNPLFLLAGDGAGHFGAPSSLAISASSLDVSDLDGDGRPDLFVRTRKTSRPVWRETATIFWGEGGGAFTAPLNLGEVLNGRFLLADLDGDGRLDIVSCTYMRTAVRRNAGGRAFEPELLVSTLGSVTLAADVDGDGHTDLVDHGSTLAVLFNTCDGSRFARSFVIPVVLSLRGVGGTPYTSDVVLTNRGPVDVSIDLTYTAAIGTGSGTVSITLPRGRQRILEDALAELRDLGLPLTPGEGHAGSLRVRFSGAVSAGDVSVSARTRSPFRSGEVGVGFAPQPVASGLLETSIVPLLLEGSSERTNLAFTSLADAEEGPVVLRVTLVSTDEGHPGSVTLPDMALDPGAFRQLDRVLTSSGLGAASGWARIERVAGNAGYGAYAVLNDGASSDGSVVPASAEVPAYYEDLYVPAVVETAGYTTALVVTSTADWPQTIYPRFVSAAVQTPTHSATRAVPVPAGAQVTLPAFAKELCTDESVPCVGHVELGGDRIFGVARTVGIGDRSGTGICVPALPLYPNAQDLAFRLDGLRQDAAHRTNVGLLNMSLVGSAAHYRLDIWNGDTGEWAAVVTDAVVTAGWAQIDSLLGTYAPGVTNGYLRAGRTDGGPAYAYAVLTDGGVPGLGTGDGTFLPMVALPAY